MTSVAPALPGTKDELVGLLAQAAQLEHALCLQYLYAAFTLKVGGEAGVSASQVALNEQWAQQVTRVAIQEMYHLLLASNLLTCLDAVPEFARPPFPQPAGTYSDIELPSMLASFSYETISRFLCWERPFTDQPDPWWEPFCKACSEKAKARAMLASVSADYATIGQLYGIIKDSFFAHPSWIVVSSASRQVTSELVAFRPAVAPITQASEAGYYIDIIVKEGEGSPNWESTSHFAYFHQIVAALEALEDTGPSFTGSVTTVDNPIYDPANAGPGRSLIDDPATARVGAVCNDLYTLLVRMLGRLFVPNGESASERRCLANAALAIMPLGVKPLAITLSRLPAGPGFPALFAGPSFELPVTLELPSAAKEEALPALQAEFREVTSACRLLSIDDTGLGAGPREEISTVAARLETLLPLLDLDDARAEVGL